jgi:hypothetical protein
MTMRNYTERWHTQQFRSEGGLTATIEKWVTIGTQWRAFVYERGMPIKACPHRHRSEKAAKDCADRMLRAELRKGD